MLQVVVAGYQLIMNTGHGSVCPPIIANHLTLFKSPGDVCPQCHGGRLPIIETMDPVERDIEFMPTKAPYDPRWMLTGRKVPGKRGLWQSHQAVDI